MTLGTFGSVIVQVLFLAALVTPNAAMPQDPKVYNPGNGVSDPVLLRSKAAEYTADALRAKITGDVELDVVVGANGTVTDVRVVKSLDVQRGLDAEAVRAARQWLFKPGMVNGRPVDVRVTLILSFRLLVLEVATGASMPDAFAEGAYVLNHPGLVAPAASRNTPRYEGADLLGLPSVVPVDVVIRADGTVARARAAASTENLMTTHAEAAVGIARQLTFSPGLLDGRAVPVIARVAVRLDR